MSGALAHKQPPSVEEFLEQGHTDHLAPWESGGGGQELITVASCLEKPSVPPNGLGVSHAFYQAGCSGGKGVKSRVSAQPLVPALWNCFKVARHSSSSCGIGKVPRNPVIPLNTFLEKMHLGTNSSQEALVLFQSITPWEMLPLRAALARPPLCLGHHILAPL